MSVNDPNPLNRPEVYAFSCSSTTVDAVSFSLVPESGYRREFIYNSAYDVLTGYKMRSVEPALTISKNLSTEPMTILRSIVNHVNSTTWAGGDIGTWLCTSLSASQKTEMVGDLPLTYWEARAAFSYREDGWKLAVKDIGLYQRTYNDAGEFVNKIPCTVIDSNGNTVTAKTPQALNPDGTQKLGSNIVSEKQYDLYKPADFSLYFGGPT